MYINPIIIGMVAMLGLEFVICFIGIGYAYFKYKKNKKKK